MSYEMKQALTTIVNKHYAETYHDGSSTGLDALREIREIAQQGLLKAQIKQESFDHCIGGLDRLLLEFLILPTRLVEIDEANRQTLKHHAYDLIGVGNAMLEKLGGEK